MVSSELAKSNVQIVLTKLHWFPAKMTLNGPYSSFCLKMRFVGQHDKCRLLGRYKPYDLDF